MFENPLKKTTPLESFLVLFVIILLIVFSGLLVRNIRLADRAWVFHEHTSISELLLKNKHTNRLSVDDIEYIDIWMTFQYINFVFGIPEDYLKDQLHITDTRYPNMTLGKYMKNENIDKADFLEKIKDMIRVYMSLQSVK